MIEYGNIADAQAALGRNLTGLEVKWFEYTADVPDYQLYWLNSAFIFIIMHLATLPTFVLELFKMLENYRCQPGVHNSFGSMIACYKQIMYLFFFLALPFQIVSYPFIKLIGIDSGLPLPSLQTMALQLGTYIIVEDFTNYWFHRWLHTDWAYERIHRVHHEYTASLSLGAFYASPWEIGLLGIPMFLGPTLVPGHMITLWIWIAMRNLEAVDVHCGYEFPWSLSSLIPFYGGAVYHDYHHSVGSKCQSNYASTFIYLDHLYGTYRGYRYQKNALSKERKNVKLVNGENGLPAEVKNKAA